MSAKARINLDTDEEKLTANISGDAKEAANKAKYESCKKSLNIWFKQLGENSLNPNIKSLEQMSKGMDNMENVFYDLIHNEFQLVDLTQDRQTFNKAKAHLNGALAEHKKNGLSPTCYEYLSTCRMFIDNFVQQLLAAELSVRSTDTDSENPEEGRQAEVA